MPAPDASLQIIKLVRLCIYVISHRLAFVGKDDIIPRQYVHLLKSQFLHVSKKMASLEVVWHAEKSGDQLSK